MQSTFNRTYNLEMVKRTSGFENANEENDIIYLDKTKDFDKIRESESFV